MTPAAIKRLHLPTLAVLALSAVLATAAGAAPDRNGASARAAPLGFGVSDNAGMFADDSGDRFFSTLLRANLSENAMVVTWQAGQLAPGGDQAAFLDRSIATANAKGVKIVMVVYPADPREHDAEQFCGFVRALAVRYPSVQEWAIGNEVNKADFWFPPTPESYLPVLARCYDALDELGKTVIGFELSPRKTPSSPSPVQYLKRAGEVLRAMGRDRPIMDLFGYHPHPNLSLSGPADVSPGKQADWPDTGPGTIDRVKQAIHDAFHGTAQPDVDQGLRIKLRELGWQVVTDGHPGYVGAENVRVVDEDTQARYYVEMIDALACDPHISELLFFLLVDERERGGRNEAGELVSGGWQSGLVRVDWTERASFAAVRDAIARTGGSCAGSESVWRPATGVIGAKAGFKDANRVHPKKGRYFAFNVRAAEEATFVARLERMGAPAATGTKRRAAAAKAVYTMKGTIKAGHNPLARFPRRLLPPGSYRYSVVVSAWANADRTSSFASKPFKVLG